MSSLYETIGFEIHKQKKVEVHSIANTPFIISLEAITDFV